MIRREFVFVFPAFLYAAGARASAQQIITGTNKGAEGIKLALPEFQPDSNDPKLAALAAVFNKVLWDDLDYSGGVTLVSRSLYPLGRFSEPGQIKIDDWTSAAVQAQYLAFGNIRTQNGISVEARLWDLKVAQNREVLGERFRSDATEEGARLIAHRLADAIIDRIGGKQGIAQTSIAHISERTPGVKELFLMDYDGNNSHGLTTYRSITLSPAWSPDGDKIAFASYRRGGPDIEILSPLDRRPYTFERAGGTTSMPAWSPDGSKIAFSTSRDGSDMEIYTADWNGKNMRRLTVNKAVDVSPVWNPRTGREIAFTSGRSGTPQIYIMDAEGTNVRRLIDEGGDAVNPAWSPDGMRIAFAWQRGTSRFDIYIHEIATGRNTQITNNAGDNEKPTWAPDGRHVAFESSRTGIKQIYSMILDGTKVRQLTNTGKNTAPAWSGFMK